MNKPFYLRLSILEISKMIMYELWYDYISSIDEQGFWAKNLNLERQKFINLLILEHLKKSFYKTQLTK